MKIGIVGNGFVGSAVSYGFSEQCQVHDSEIRIYDKNPKLSTHTLSETLESDFIFVSVPTPSNEDGSINLDIIYSLFRVIHRLNKRDDNVILLRSTVTPGTTRRLQVAFHNLNIVFNPEFLTQASAKFDFINQSRCVLGGDEDWVKKVTELFKWRFGDSFPVIETDWETAEMIKYMNNTFFATKVSFMNEMYQIAKNSDVDWDVAVDGFVRDGRVGHSHLNVPGPDGKLGFGGVCFPKDIQAMIHFAESRSVEPNVLKGAWDTNLEVRPEEDWKQFKGRSVVEEK